MSSLPKLGKRDRKFQNTDFKAENFNSMKFSDVIVRKKNRFRIVNGPKNATARKLQMHKLTLFGKDCDLDTDRYIWV